MSDKKKKKVKDFKFSISTLIHRVSKLKIRSDVIIDGEVIENHVVGWVKVRGSKDPIYLAASSEHMKEFQDTITDSLSEEDDEKGRMIDEATERFKAVAVACSIVEWDEVFFEKKFDLETAIKMFQEQKNFVIYNQVAMHMQKSLDFLPNASQPL